MAIDSPPWCKLKRTKHDFIYDVDQARATAQLLFTPSGVLCLSTYAPSRARSCSIKQADSLRSSKRHRRSGSTNLKRS